MLWMFNDTRNSVGRVLAHHAAVEAVLGRMVELLNTYPKAVQSAREGGRDALVEWFEDTYEYRDMPSAEFVDLIVEKLEG